MHVEQVLGDVPKADRCDCHTTKSTKKASGEAPAWLKSFFGKV